MNLHANTEHIVQKKWGHGTFKVPVTYLLQHQFFSEKENKWETEILRVE